MSRFDAFTAGWSFRTTTPSFEAGEEITAFVTGYEDGAGVARIGDTVLTLTDAAPELVDTQVDLRIEEFDDSDHTGRATILSDDGN
ncbi:hypothetical protein [Halococcus sp. IIIV-5B]|uniref:DUF7513 family protein n=1 Tax=Halococcus sp. IIIV-5B TaxID=2321230 RepID=UPI000E76C0B9|nr:hypothetical protein [Halococcus sp. IIIV-5B]RJT04066.1 hypothetical protein D3261_09840 [Halococcus sp. IIIV-5B]